MSQAENHLFELLPRTERTRLRALATAVHLVQAEVLCEAHRPTRHVYFPVDAFVLLVAPITGHPGIEVGMTGREGLIGDELAMGVTRSPLLAQVQGAGLAWRLNAGVFRSELERSPNLRRLVLRHLHVRMVQLAVAAACFRYHLIGPRLARCLLMSQDRAHQAQFHVTHEGLASMLGVRRVGVTVAAGVLQGLGLIRYRRGELTVLDRAGLQAHACACYAADCDTYAEWLGSGEPPAIPAAAD